MPKKSKGSKSKRQTLSHKYKVIRKVKEHAKKLAKNAKKSGHKPKVPKDPGLPKQWPFKQELIQELEKKKELILQAEARKKEERKRARVRSPPVLLPHVAVCLSAATLAPVACHMHSRHNE